MSSRSPSSQKYRYLQCFGPGLLQNIAIYMLLGGQCSQAPLFTQHLPSHTGAAVSVVETGCQPKVSLFTMFWARAAPKHRYLHALGRPLLPNTIIYLSVDQYRLCGKASFVKNLAPKNLFPCANCAPSLRHTLWLVACKMSYYSIIHYK